MALSKKRRRRVDGPNKARKKGGYRKTEWRNEIRYGYRRHGAKIRIFSKKCLISPSPQSNSVYLTISVRRILAGGDGDLKSPFGRVSRERRDEKKEEQKARCNNEKVIK